MSELRDRPKPPKSATSFALNMVGPIVAAAVIYYFRQTHFSGSNAVLLVCVAGVVPIVLLDVFVLKVHRREATGLDWDRDGRPHNGRVATKLLGLLATLAPIALGYYVFPEYGDWYGIFWNTLKRFGVSFAIIAVMYTWFVDGQMKDPYDAYWQLGRAVLGHREDVKPGVLPNHFRGWMVKAFYLPLFVVFTHNQIGGILTYDLAQARQSDVRMYHFLSDGIYALDVLYATVGYVLSTRLLDTQLRSAEPTMFGWVVALECYMPFWGRVFSPLYLHYEGIQFDNWLSGSPGLRMVWIALILVCEGIYLLATFAFGVRFSNLTHRGILTGGPYRFTKHPAYVAKNISWWLITLPFIPYASHDWQACIKSTLGLAGVSTIYLLRAKTEEWHLSRDPVYVEYAKWIDDHGWLRFFRHVPFIRYTPPKPPAPPAPAPELPIEPAPEAPAAESA